jgi:hypothetical protein
MSHITYAYIYESIVRTQPESVTLAERLAEENGGILPSPRELRSAGYKGLQDTIRVHPEAFAHIEQEEQRSPKKPMRKKNA